MNEDLFNKSNRWARGHDVVRAITMRGNLPIRVNPRSGLTSTFRIIGQTLDLVPVPEHNACGMTMNYGRMTNWLTDEAVASHSSCYYIGR